MTTISARNDAPSTDAGRVIDRGWLLVAASAVLYTSLALPLVLRQGVHWDEQTDLEIAASFLDGPRALVTGSGVDSITTRLPMFLAALLDLVGLDLSVLSVRALSCVAGVLALGGTYRLGLLVGDRRTAATAVLILATSPYFLAYSPLGLSEGDIFIATAIVWTAVAAVEFTRRPTWWRCARLGTLLGLCVSAKFSGIALVPALALAVVLPVARKRSYESLGQWKSSVPWLAISVTGAAWLVWQAAVTGAALAVVGNRLPSWLQSGGLRYLLVVAAWSTLIGWSWRNRRRLVSLPGLFVLPLVVAAATFFVFPPAHTVNKWLFSSLWATSVSSGGTIDPGYVAEIGLFHFMVVLLKPGILIGLALWAGVVRALIQVRSRPERRLLLAIGTFYFGFLLLLPWAQVRYMIPLFPLMAILGADLLVDVGRARPWAAAVLATLVGIELAGNYRLTYPDLNLNGYQWLGARYVGGRSTLGYRAIGQVGEDGVEQILRWSLSSIPAGANVASYLSAQHIVAAILVEPPFRVHNGLEHPAAMDAADYVLTSLNGDLVVGDGPLNPEGDPFSYPLYDRARLEQEFDRVFSVRRAFGLEVATVWRRR